MNIKIGILIFLTFIGIVLVAGCLEIPDKARTNQVPQPASITQTRVQEQSELQAKLQEQPDLEGKWTADNIFTVTGDGYRIDWVFDYDTSTVQGLYRVADRFWNETEFRENAQSLINEHLGGFIMGHKITSIDISGDYGNDTLILIQELGKPAEFTRINFAEFLRSILDPSRI